MSRIALVIIGSMMLAFLPSLHAEPVESAALEWPIASFYLIGGGDDSGVGISTLSAQGTYSGLEFYTRDTSEDYYLHDCESERSTLALTAGIGGYDGKNRLYVANAILGYYKAKLVDNCATGESDDSGLDYGVAVSVSIMTSPRFGYMLGVRYTAGGEAGFTLGLSW